MPSRCHSCSRSRRFTCHLNDCNQLVTTGARRTTGALGAATRTGGLFRGFGDGFEKRVPTEGGALDAHRKLHDALKGLDIAKID